MDEQTPKASASTRTRITREAIQLLHDYAKTVTSYPSRNEKTQLLERIHAIPGNEAFTFEKISSWFARHRNPAHSLRRREWSATAGHKDTSPTEVLRFADDDSILFPSFTPTQLHQLQQLYRNRPDPAEGVITFWATRLKADREEVAAWIAYQRETTKGQSPQAAPASDHTSSLSPTSPTDPFARTHLPTPAKSPSPNKSPDMRIPSLPPVAVKMEESGQYSPSPATPGSANISPVDRLTNVVPIIRKPGEALARRTWLSQPRLDSQAVGNVPSAMDALLMQSLRNALVSSTDNRMRDVPSTVSEFEECFRPYEERINHFMEIFTSGRLGWHPSLDDGKIPSVR